jgi:hypothetical protein
MKRSLLCTLCLLLAGLLSSCERPPAPAEHVAPTHHHTAPHGGVLVEVGSHQFNLELLHDAATGTLTLYTLDAHAENFVRTAMRAIDVTLHAGGQIRSLTLKSVANPATGETVGATSQYEVQDDWLKASGEISGIITELDFNGTKFSGIPFASTKH